MVPGPLARADDWLRLWRGFIRPKEFPIPFDYDDARETFKFAAIIERRVLHT